MISLLFFILNNMLKIFLSLYTILPKTSSNNIFYIKIMISFYKKIILKMLKSRTMGKKKKDWWKKTTLNTKNEIN